MEPFLDGIRVLDLTQYLAGPACTRMLREMGAEIIKVELAPYGDPTRAFTPRVNRRSGFWVQQSRGKKSLCVDWSRPESADLVRELAEHCDVLVENFSPGVLGRRGLGYEDLSAINPGLIYASISGFGHSGPLKDRPTFEFIAQAYAGVMHLTGDPDGPPYFVGMGIADTNAGVHAYGAIGHALFRRERTGRGTYIDCSMVDALVHMHETGIFALDLTDGEYTPQRQGRYYQAAQPGAVYRAPEGWITLFAAANQIDGLWAALGHPEYAHDDRFHNNDARLAHREELTKVIEDWMAGFDTDDEVIDALAAHRVPCSKVLSPADLGDEDHLRARGMIREVTDRLVGTVTVPGFPIQFSEQAPAEDGVAPDLGQHNAEILGGILGYDEARIAEMVEDGLLFSKNR